MILTLFIILKNSTMKTRLDSTSIGILKLLNQNGKLTNKELASSLNLSISPIFERRKRLEDLGFIKKYIAVIDRSKLESGLICITKITMLKHSGESFSNFRQAIMQAKEVLECYQLTGTFDFMLKIMTQDMASYYKFIQYNLANIEDVGKIITSSVISQIKSEYDQNV